MTNEHQDNIEAIRDALTQSFNVNGSLTLLPGGEGRTYRAGNFIYRHEDDPIETAFIAEL